MAARNVDIDIATAEDLESVVVCWMDLVGSQHAYGAHIDAAKNETAARDVLARYIARDDILVARSPSPTNEPVNSILGFVMFHLEYGLFEQDEQRGIIENLYVVPSQRGQGIGSALMNRAESTLKHAGADVIAVSVMAGNDGARRLYRRRGYSLHRLTYERDVSDASD